jgi:hypothetical protein
LTDSKDCVQRSLLDARTVRYKALIGPRQRARRFSAHETEAAIGVAVLNGVLAGEGLDSVRCLPVIA